MTSFTLRIDQSYAPLLIQRDVVAVNQTFNAHITYLGGVAVRIENKSPFMGIAEVTLAAEKLAPMPVTTGMGDTPVYLPVTFRMIALSPVGITDRPAFAICSVIIPIHNQLFASPSHS